MADLARDLRELELAWPETPDLAGAVAARLAEPETAPRRAGLRRGVRPRGSARRRAEPRGVPRSCGRSRPCSPGSPS